jgi:CHASE1-domain containing sensor protein
MQSSAPSINAAIAAYYKRQSLRSSNQFFAYIETLAVKINFPSLPTFYFISKQKARANFEARAGFHAVNCVV